MKALAPAEQSREQAVAGASVGEQVCTQQGGGWGNSRTSGLEARLTWKQLGCGGWGMGPLIPS